MTKEINENGKKKYDAMRFYLPQIIIIGLSLRAIYINKCTQIQCVGISIFNLAAVCFQNGLTNTIAAQK